jgi:hypothetical protein
MLHKIFSTELLCHDVISLEYGEEHINVSNVNKAVKATGSTLWIREWMHIRPITLYKSCISIRTRKLPWCYNYQQVMLSQKLKFVFAAFQLREWESSGWFRILKLCPWKWEYDRRFAMHNMNEWTLNKL